METFKEYISETEQEPWGSFWSEFPSLSTGNHYAILYVEPSDVVMRAHGKGKFFVELVNLPRTIKCDKYVKANQRTVDGYLKACYSKCKIYGRIDAKTKFCAVLHDDDAYPVALLPISNLKGCETEIRKCIAKQFGVDVNVQKLSPKIIKMLED